MWEYASSFDTLAVAQAFAGSASEAIATSNEGNRLAQSLRKQISAARTSQLAQLQHARAESAIAAIVKAAANRQIVILNEAHNVSMHRAFAMKLARELRRMGFDYLACETFATDHPNPIAGGYVHPNDGYFSREPMYATFLQDAAADGWKFVSYEPASKAGVSPEQHARRRDYEMARNIVTRILEKNPKARIFMYVGYGHGSKMPLSQSEDDKPSHVGAQLRRLTGIDPLSIDQVTLFPEYQTREQQTLYRAAVKFHPLTQPFVLSTRGGQFLTVGKLPGQYDLQVVYPGYGIDKETMRPTWMAKLAGLAPMKAPADMLPKSGRRLLYAFRENSPDDAIALDIISTTAGQAAPSFMLAPGRYRYRYED
ncbi:hypothetical protein PO883_11230 [Massilia sp. DJPM01]|uniref:hypothetical protein n=1 Tax=Massilia sp. DJPM01 TaxID=3024404 RepID=UPI00259E2BFE|nr:hypothetical protein [Massilia sp. DJPM01]MDM5177765.1 hypothetical protein [Massilia sp. DJPM01]